jgi:hypothetical protein
MIRNSDFQTSASGKQRTIPDFLLLSGKANNRKSSTLSVLLDAVLFGRTCQKWDLAANTSLERNRVIEAGTSQIAARNPHPYGT